VQRKVQLTCKGYIVIQLSFAKERRCIVAHQFAPGTEGKERYLSYIVIADRAKQVELELAVNRFKRTVIGQVRSFRLTRRYYTKGLIHLFVNGSGIYCFVLRIRCLYCNKHR